VIMVGAVCGGYRPMVVVAILIIYLFVNKPCSTVKKRGKAYLEARASRHICVSSPRSRCATVIAVVVLSVN
jgi:hypothetical protein